LRKYPAWKPPKEGKETKEGKATKDEESAAAPKNAFCKPMPGIPGRPAAATSQPGCQTLEDVAKTLQDIAKGKHPTVLVAKAKSVMFSKAPPSSNDAGQADGGVSKAAALVAKSGVQAKPLATLAADNGGDAAAGGAGSVLNPAVPVAPAQPKFATLQQMQQQLRPLTPRPVAAPGTSPFLTLEQMAGALHPAVSSTAPALAIPSAPAVATTSAAVGFAVPPTGLFIPVAPSAPAPSTAPPIPGIIRPPPPPSLDPHPLTAAHGAHGERLNEAQKALLAQLAGALSPGSSGGTQVEEQTKEPVLVDVKVLRFVHKTIHKTFASGEQKGQPLQTLLDDLIAGKLSPTDLPPLTVVNTEKGLEVITGNRRLYCLKRYVTEASPQANVAANVWCRVYDLKGRDTPRPVVMKYISCQGGESSGFS